MGSAWSPDGAHLVFSSIRSGTPQIYVMTADGRDVRRLTNSASSAVAPRGSPDGKSIAFVSGRDATGDLYTIGANGQGIERLTVGAGVTRDPPLWSPDGSRIMFQIASAENYDIGVVRLSDRSRSLLATSSAYDGSYTWSPDGKRVAFISGRAGYDGIYTADADGHDYLSLTGTASLTPAWGSQRSGGVTRHCTGAARLGGGSLAEPSSRIVLDGSAGLFRAVRRLHG